MTKHVRSISQRWWAILLRRTQSSAASLSEKQSCLPDTATLVLQREKKLFWIPNLLMFGSRDGQSQRKELLDDDVNVANWRRMKMMKTMKMSTLTTFDAHRPEAQSSASSSVTGCRVHKCHPLFISRSHHHHLHHDCHDHHREWWLLIPFLFSCRNPFLYFVLDIDDKRGRTNLKGYIV